MISKELKKQIKDVKSELKKKSSGNKNAEYGISMNEGKHYSIDEAANGWTVRCGYGVGDFIAQDLDQALEIVKEFNA